MSISEIDATMNNQLYQIATQKNNGQSLRQTQSAGQGATEESRETTAVHSKEVSQRTEGMESKSINLYA